MVMKIIIYTDGSSRGNPGPGGWGAIILTNDEVLELGGGEKNTTNNRMELMGAISGLREIAHKVGNEQVSEVEVRTDSEYVKKGMTEWINGWIAKGWKTASKKPVLNQDLWQALKHEEDRLNKSGVHVSWVYVEAHAGIALNERADTIATSCADAIGSGHAGNIDLYRGSRDAYPHSI
jgi:ribonuclease HI